MSSDEVLAKHLALRDEEDRAQRHHEVMMMVLKELLRSRLSNGEGVQKYILTETAREVADLAYPPPKETP